MQIMTWYSGWDKREMDFFGNVSHSWGNGTLRHTPYLTGGIIGWEGLPWYWAEVPWGRGNVMKAELFLLSFPMHLISYSFNPEVFWNFPTRFLDFHKSSLVCVWLSKLVFFRGSWTSAPRDWSRFMGHFRVHIWEQCLYVYYLMHKWWESSQAPWYMILVSEAKVHGSVAEPAGVELIP